MSPETIAGRYRVLQPIGRGGMGTVWLCRDEVLGREVAVKRVGRLPEGWDDVGSGPDRARALREARSAAALNHRNVVSVFDVVEDGGENWLVMEYVPGRTLPRSSVRTAPSRRSGPRTSAHKWPRGSRRRMLAARSIGT